jgi:membrane protein implicated in regulation of membrane protease activity
MKANVGGIDRILRIVVGLALIAAAIAGMGTPWTWIGIVPLATGLIKFCPLYPLLGMSTCPKQ